MTEGGRDGEKMVVVHLTASTFYGGPERQMLGLAHAWRRSVECRFLSFPEHDRCWAFIEQARQQGFQAAALSHDFPFVHWVIRDLTERLRRWQAQVLFCHGYKANLLGRLAARRLGIPAVAVARGWTWESWRVRLYEWLDRRHLACMDHVVCVSHSQAERVRRWCGVPAHRISVIYNSARPEAFATVDRQTARERLMQLVPAHSRWSHLVVGAGRLSPEKGFSVLIEAAARLQRSGANSIGWLIFGEGRLRSVLEAQIDRYGLRDCVFLPGFRHDLDQLLPGADLVVVPSYTEGMPNVALEASAAGVAVVATAVGGTPEVVIDGQTGYLVPAGDVLALASRIRELLDNPALRSRLGSMGRLRMDQQFSFNAQAAAYQALTEKLLSSHRVTNAVRNHVYQVSGGCFSSGLVEQGHQVASVG
ncbi:MAG: glycosyltransferase [Thermogemmata sp.]|nr:glycosyltransferase [Thermogemmata sp.]